MHSFVPAIYDATICISKSSPAPTMLKLFKGQPSVVHVYLKQHEMKDLPENDDAIAQWCRDIYVAKHFWCCLVTCFPPVSYWTNILPKTLLEKKSCKTMPPNQIPCGSCILGMHSYLRTIKILQATALLSSWKGVAISAALIAVTVLMQILINFSKSERSTAAQGCIRKDKEYESGFRGNGQEDKTH